MTGRSACLPSVNLQHQSVVGRFAHNDPDGGEIKVELGGYTTWWKVFHSLIIYVTTSKLQKATRKGEPLRRG
jgi:hypothetical protein